MTINSLDIETTGFSHKRGDKIIQLAFVEKFNNGEERIGNILLNPLRNIPKEATDVHGIKNSDIINSPIFSDFKEIIFDILKNSINMGHNIKKFDLPFILQELLESGFDKMEFIGIKFFDTLLIARKIISIPKYDLDSLLKYFDIDIIRNQHDAQQDAELTYLVYKELEKLCNINEFIEEIDIDYLDKYLIENRNSKKMPKYMDATSQDVELIKKLISEKNNNLKLVFNPLTIDENFNSNEYVSIWSYSRLHNIFSQLILDELILNNILNNNYHPTLSSIENNIIKLKKVTNNGYSILVQKTKLQEIFVSNKEKYHILKKNTKIIALNTYKDTRMPLLQYNKTEEVSLILEPPVEKEQQIVEQPQESVAWLFS